MSLIRSLRALLTWLWWWATPVCTRRGFTRAISHHTLDPHARLPRYPGPFLRSLLADNPHYAAEDAVSSAPSEARALAAVAALPRLPRSELHALTRWRRERLAEIPAATAILSARACDERIALHVVQACWFLGFGYYRFERFAALEPRPPADELRAEEEAVLQALAPFPAARFCVEVFRAFPHTLPHDLEHVFPLIRTLSPAAREVALTLMRDDAPPDPSRSSEGRTAAELAELLTLSRHCLS